MALIPAPPDLKPTIIQMQNTNNENESVLENSPRLQPNDANGPKKRRRRSSSSLISQSEVEKRRREHKTAHSIIEKKRRIRMNREFEALKYLIPACRNSLISGSNSNNGEGMYKLTILQATVDYIKYLHQVINIQNNELKNFKSDIDIEEDNSTLQFAQIDLNTEDYRNVDNEFDFNKLLEDFTSKNLENQPRILTRHSEPIRPTASMDFNFKFQALPSPIITPELYPRTSSNSNSPANFNLKSDFQFPTNNPKNHQRSSSISSTQLTKLEIINEKNLKINNNYLASNNLVRSDSDLFINLSNNNNENGHAVDADSANVLLSMKKDAGAVSSIQSLLN